MSINSRNLALPVIVAVATLIIINAVIGQDGRHPAPIGSNGQAQKITKSKTSIFQNGLLKRKASPARTVAVAPRVKPKFVPTGLNGDGIGQLLKAGSGTPKKQSLSSVEFQNEKKVRFVQTRLDQLGYAPGPVDGVFGQKTREAIKKFENDRRFPVTGEISPALLKALARSASFASLALT